MSDTVSPDFARASNVTILRVEKPTTSQLGRLGSMSKINFTMTAVIKFGSITAKKYLYITNLDKYNSIPGTAFFRRRGFLQTLNSRIL